MAIFRTFAVMCRQRKILCVDDDGDDRCLLTETLKDMAPDVEVIEKENGVDALLFLEQAKCDNGLPCLVVLDINMPLLDGKQTLLRIQQDVTLQQVPVVVFTSSENPNDGAFFKSKGVDMIVKPYDHTYFKQIVKRFLVHCG